MKKKNIIIYFSDQQRWDTVNEKVTPNLMQLASEGVKFENNFTCQPVCGPARACLQTGVYATQCGCYWNGVPLPKSIVPLAHYFNRGGYQTAYIGTWHRTDCRTSAHTAKKRQCRKKSRANTNTGVLQMCLNLHHTAMTDMCLTATATKLISRDTEQTA